MDILYLVALNQFKTSQCGVFALIIYNSLQSAKRHYIYRVTIYLSINSIAIGRGIMDIFNVVMSVITALVLALLFVGIPNWII